MQLVMIPNTHQSPVGRALEEAVVVQEGCGAHWWPWLHTDTAYCSKPDQKNMSYWQLGTLNKDNNRDISVPVEK